MEYIGITAVVLNYRTVQRTIENVDILIFQNPGIRVVIVDNCSNDGSMDALVEKYGKSDNIDVISSEVNGGYSKGNNYGIRYAKAHHEGLKYIVIMNPDVKCPQKNMLVEMMRELEGDKRIGILAPMMIQDGSIVVSKIGWKCDDLKRAFQKRMYWANTLLPNTVAYRQFKMSNQEQVAYVDVVQGSFFMISIDLFSKVGLFDENVFLYCEENILAQKIKKLGYTEGVSLHHYYIHEHSLERASIEKRRNSKRQEFKSERYYCKTCLNANVIILFLLDICAFLYLNFEIYLWEGIHKLKCVGRQNER